MDLDDFRRRLEERLETLRGRVEKIDADLRRPEDRDSEEQALQAENDQVLEHLDAADRDEIEAIRRALARIDDGTYGECTRCGAGIAEKRLVAVPHTSVCGACAA
jgi:RNA polymerase-binding transcription factor DksA